MLLSLVVPVFNEAQTVHILVSRIREALRGFDWQILFVNDGSTDDTLIVVNEMALSDPRIKVLSFSRNFGHQAAVTAGLDFAEGDAVVVMDADLQDPPELIPEMVRFFEQGYDVVSPQRVARQGETWFKRGAAAVFYRMMARMVDRRLTPDVGDFRLFSRRAVLAIRSFREQHRYMRGLVAWLGLREVTVPFVRQPRAAGETKYPLHKMIRFAWTAVSSFSALPLRLSIAAGTILSCTGFGYLLYVTYLALWTHTLVPGWASVVILQCIFSGMILLALGAIGDYVGRNYEESKSRPLYVVASTFNLAVPNSGVARATIFAGPHIHDIPVCETRDIVSSVAPDPLAKHAAIVRLPVARAQ